MEDPLRGLEVLASAEVSIDVRRVDQVGLLVGPRVRVGEDRVELTSVGVLGEPAHGVYTVGADQRLTVARLDRLLPRELRTMVVGARPLLVPRTDEERFLDDFVPGLRRHAPVGSRDGSVDLPVDVPPRLSLTVTPRDEHRVRLDWSFRYVPPGSAGPGDRLRPRRPGVPPAAGTRRPNACSWSTCPLPYAATPVLAEPGTAPPTPAAHALLDGLDAALFVERVLPALEAAGVEVRLAGDLPGYRESVAEPAIAVSATERADTADWFDLHVEVSVEGERVPFDQLFVALSQGEEHLVLESGVWFSLRRPGLDRLRDLIEESRGAGRLRAGRAHPQPLPGLALGGPRRPRGRRLPGRALVAGGPRPGGQRPPADARPAADAAGRAAALPARGLRLAAHPLVQRAGRDPRRRHGSGQDGADPRARGPGPAGAAGGAALPGGRADQRGAGLGRRGGPLRPLAPGRRVRLPYPAPRLAGRAGGGGRRGRHLVRAAAARRRRDRRARLVGAGAGRGAVRQEPPGEDLPGGTAGRRPVRPGHHRHPAREQPDGPLVAAVGDRARAVPLAAAVLAVLPPGDRAGRGRRQAPAAAAADPAVRAAADQAGRRRRPAAQAGAGPRGRARPAAHARLPDPPAARAGRRCSGCSTTSTATVSPCCGR